MTADPARLLPKTAVTLGRWEIQRVILILPRTERDLQSQAITSRSSLGYHAVARHLPLDTRWLPCCLLSYKLCNDDESNAMAVCTNASNYSTPQVSVKGVTSSSTSSSADWNHLASHEPIDWHALTYWAPNTRKYENKVHASLTDLRQHEHVIVAFRLQPCISLSLKVHSKRMLFFEPLQITFLSQCFNVNLFILLSHQLVFHRYQRFFPANPCSWTRLTPFCRR